MGVKRATAPPTCARNDVSDGITGIRKCQSDVYDQLRIGLIPRGLERTRVWRTRCSACRWELGHSQGLEATSATVTAGKQEI
jgi:hypothetical protein